MIMDLSHQEHRPDSSSSDDGTVPGTSATLAPEKGQDNNVLNAAAALLSMPMQVTCRSVNESRTSLGSAPFVLKSPHQQYAQQSLLPHDRGPPSSTALVDLVSPAGLMSMNSIHEVIVPASAYSGNTSHRIATSTHSAADDMVSADTAFYEGTCSLSLPEDDDFLSPLHSFIRRYCVETFTATAQDAADSQFGRSHGSRVVPGQVGIRCVHCAKRQYSSAGVSGGTEPTASSTRRERAVCFPSSLKNIYHSIETWQRRHSLVCQDIPPWVKASMAELCRTSKSGAGGRRQYWEDSARRIGLVNTAHGIRFIRPPGDLGPPSLTEEANAAVAGATRHRQTGDHADIGPSSALSWETFLVHGVPVVRGDDKALVKDYLYVLLDQMEQCYFSEEDRAGGRSKVKDCPIGYPGMQCRHCKGKAGFGRYFPGTLAALTSANSDRNIFNHIMKCRRCPQSVKDELSLLQQQHQTLKNRRGSRKLFFEKIWKRLHGDQTSVAEGEHPMDDGSFHQAFDHEYDHDHQEHDAVERNPQSKGISRLDLSPLSTGRVQY